MGVGGRKWELVEDMPYKNYGSYTLLWGLINGKPKDIHSVSPKHKVNIKFAKDCDEL